MATYYGGETLYDVVHTVATTATLGENDTLTLYTVPTGYYALIKFAYIERNDSSPNGEYGTGQATIRLVGDDNGLGVYTGLPIGIDLTLNTLSSGSTAGQSTGWDTHKIWYTNYLPGTVLYVDGFSSNVVKYYSPFNMYAGPGDIIQIQTSSFITGNSATFRYVLDYHIFKQP